MLALIGSLASVPAAAVYRDASGIGQALIYPYYTVRSAGGNQYNTYISVANTSSRSVAVKVRLREGRAGYAVAEFNLYLLPDDMWTAVLVPNGEGARLLTRDRSCTKPALPAEGLVLSDLDYYGRDDFGNGLDRTTEGYMEIIEMATLSAPFAAAVADCARVQTEQIPAASIGPPVGLLTGVGTLINVASGLDATYVADALARLTTRSFFSEPGQPGTDFDSPEVDPVSHFTADNVAYRLLWQNGVQAVNGALTAWAFENEFVLDAATASKTDWVLTFPTKRLLVSSSAALPPFNTFNPGPGRARCNNLFNGASDREGRRYFPVNDMPGLPSSFWTCWSATAFSVRTVARPLPFGTSDVLGARNTLGWPESLSGPSATPPPGAASYLPADFENGRMVLGFAILSTPSLPGSTALSLASGNVTSGPMSLRGLPAVGFMVRTLENGTLTCAGGRCQGNYASAIPHRRMHGVYP